jgi:hypothetical protein
VRFAGAQARRVGAVVELRGDVGVFLNTAKSKPPKPGPRIT